MIDVNMGYSSKKRGFTFTMAMSLVAIIIVIFLIASSALATTLDKQGKGGGFEIGAQCPASSVSFDGFDNSNDKTVYHFSGVCSWSSSTQALPQISYTIIGTWDKKTKTAVEEIDASIDGSIRRSSSCNYDPWLDPDAFCRNVSIQILNPSWEMNQITADLIQKSDFPFTNRASLDYRPSVLEKVLAQSVRITMPEEDGEKYKSPDQVMVMVLLDVPVRVEILPDRLVELKGEEIKWPDPNESPETAKPPRSFFLFKKLSGSAVYFPLRDEDLWGGKWSVKAHFVAADPHWSDPVSFSVEPRVALNEPPSQEKEPLIIPEKKPLKYTAAPVILNPAENAPFPKAGKNIPITVNAGTTTTVLAWEVTYKDFDGTYFVRNPSLKVRVPTAQKKKIVREAKFKPPKAGHYRFRVKGSETKTFMWSPWRKIVVGEASATPMSAKVSKGVKPQVTLKPSPHLNKKPTQLSIVPIIQNPAENKTFSKAGVNIPITIKTGTNEPSLVWEVGHKPFQSGVSFATQSLKVRVPKKERKKVTRNASFKPAKDGYYRFRVKLGAQDARWSQWRTIIIGKKVDELKLKPTNPARKLRPVKPAVRNMKIN